MNFRIKYTLAEWMIIFAIILIVARFVFAPWIQEWTSIIDNSYLYLLFFVIFTGAFIFKRWQKLYTVYFVSAKDKFETSLAMSGIKISEDSVILIARNKKDNQELLLTIGVPEDELRKDPSLKQVKEEHNILIFNPFKTGEFSSEFADAVIYYYLIKVLEKLKNDNQSFFQKLPFIFHRVKFCLNAEIQQYDKIENEKKDEFEQLLSENLLVKSFAIK